MDFVGASAVWRTKTNGGLAGDEGWLVRNLGKFNCLGNRVLIMTVNSKRVPAGSGETCRLVGVVGQRDRAVDGDVVVIPKNDQLIELQVTCQRQGFLADAFHEAAVTNDRIGVVVNEAVAELCIQNAFGKRHAHSIGNALSKWTSCGFDASGMTVFRMTCGACAELAEILDFIKGDVFVAREEEQRIKKHRAVTCRKHETVAIRPMRILRVVRQETGVKSRCYVGCTHRQAWVA